MNIALDIKQIVSDLLATGLTQQQLADLAQCSQAAINAFLKGNRGLRPSLAIGQRLIDLHKERVPAKPHKAPTLPRTNPNGEKAREAKAKAMVGRMKIDSKNLAQ
jgi:transcriptional regulator with XRE-family HTH domain